VATVVLPVIAHQINDNRRRSGRDKDTMKRILVFLILAMGALAVTAQQPKPEANTAARLAGPAATAPAKEKPTTSTADQVAIGELNQKIQAAQQQIQQWAQAEQQIFAEWNAAHPGWIWNARTGVIEEAPAETKPAKAETKPNKN
jgi:hypothetical protein